VRSPWAQPMRRLGEAKRDLEAHVDTHASSSSALAPPVEHPEAPMFEQERETGRPPPDREQGRKGLRKELPPRGDKKGWYFTL
jgi:hypothetical protein